MVSRVNNMAIIVDITTRHIRPSRIAWHHTISSRQGRCKRATVTTWFAVGNMASIAPFRRRGGAGGGVDSCCFFLSWGLGGSSKSPFSYFPFPILPFAGSLTHDPILALPSLALSFSHCLAHFPFTPTFPPSRGSLRRWTSFPSFSPSCWRARNCPCEPSGRPSVNHLGTVPGCPWGVSTS